MFGDKITKACQTMIRKFKVNDTDAVVSIWRMASEFAHPFLFPAFLDTEAAALRNVYLAHAQTWVTERGGEVVGFVALIDNEVAGLFLDPAYHRQGFGSAMIDMAVAEKGPLKVDVFKENAAGRRFYEARGFHFTGEYLHEASGQVTLQMTMSPA
jgi:putative acetyltransferase